MKAMDGVIRPGILGPLVGQVPEVRVVSVTPAPVVAQTWGTSLDGVRRLPTQQIVFPAAPLVTPAARPFNWRPALMVAATIPMIAVVSAGGLRIIEQRWVWDSSTAQAQAESQSTRSVAPSSKPAVVVSSTAQESAQLQNLVNQFVASGQGEQYGIVAKDLTTGATAASGQNTTMDSASLYKLFVADQILAGVDSGQYSLGQSVADADDTTISSCLDLMITISDNSCGIALGTIIGWQDQNSALATLGFTDTNLANPLQQTDAADVALLFEKLYRGTLLSPSSNNLFLTFLKDQKVNNRLPQGLPPGTVIAHKTGDLYDNVHDAGIIYSGKTPYIVVVMSRQWNSTDNAPARFAELSSQLWTFFNP